jgi:aspartokinase/homoserine dehydrogenase 1
VANAERFLRVADILESNARQGQVATVLSAPAKITNHLVAMIEKTISGQDALPNISDAERIFAELLTGLAALSGSVGRSTISGTSGQNDHQSI